ncbi:MAG TPA: M48 family metallopeptidase [Candidatus Magasanikbacteria bacterium]|nr:M48 family metallopeptidase [Candidatus Magasanikbacteria bacterium]
MYNEIDSNKRKTWLLVTVFLALFIFLGWFLDKYFGGGNGGIFALAIIISLGMTLVSYFQGDKIALASTGARAIAKDDNPYIYRMVENLCITAGLPTPKIYIIQSPALNAFATGRDPQHASIALTTGIIEALENEELEGVIAHELSHVQNYDIRLMTMVVVLVGAIALMSNMFFHGGMFRGRRSSNNDSNSSIGGILAIVGIVLLILSPIISELIKLAISRKREYLADASGALLTRYPEGLARALEKISVSKTPLATASTATAHLFISNPLKPGMSVAGLFSTHPPIEERIKKLRGMA